MMGAVCGAVSVPKKILILGPNGSGKTTLLYAWCSKTDVEITPTASFNVETVYGVKERQLLLVFDIPSSHRRRQFFHGTDGIVYVVDCDNTSLDKVKSDFHTTLLDRDLVHLPLMLVITKSDLQGVSAVELETHLDVSSLNTDRAYSHVTTSVKDSSTFKDALETLCHLIFS